MTRTCSQPQEQVRPRLFVAQDLPRKAVVAVVPAPYEMHLLLAEDRKAVTGFVEHSA